MNLDWAPPASLYTMLSFLHFHWPASPRLHTLYYISQTVAYGLHACTKDFFCLRHAISLFIHCLHLPSSLSHSASLGSHLTNHSEKCSLLHFPTLFSCIFSSLAAMYLHSVWCGGWGEAKLGAQGHAQNARTVAKRYGEKGGSGVVQGEQCYLINTNARSKLFRQVSNTPLSLACGMHETHEPIRWDEIRPNHLWGYFAHTYIDLKDEAGGLWW